MFISACLLIQSHKQNVSIRDNKQLLATSVFLDIALLSISVFAILLATSSGNFFGLNSAFGYLLTGSSVLLSTILSILILSILKNKTSKEELTKQVLQLSATIKALEEENKDHETSKEQLLISIHDLQDTLLTLQAELTNSPPEFDNGQDL